MLFQEYMELMKKRLTNNFDMTVPFEYAGYSIDLFAESHLRTERYFASKKVKVYGMENDEFCFMKHFDMITEDIVDAYIEMLIGSIDDMVKLRDDHMSTIITGIIVADSVDDKNIESIVKRFRHQKSYAFGLKGWVDVRLILVDLQEKKVVPSKKAVKVETFYRP
jgi:hypothetical protein